MEVKFTKGEWTLRKNLDKPENWDVVAPNVSYICELGANWEGNGPLIASAPELYEVCAAIERLEVLFILPDETPEEHRDEAKVMFDLYQDAIKALKRARGES